MGLLWKIVRLLSLVGWYATMHSPPIVAVTIRGQQSVVDDGPALDVAGGCIFSIIS